MSTQQRTSVVPDLIDTMVADFAARLPGVIVSDGYSGLNEPGTALYVGVDDPASTSPANAATSSQDWPLLTGRSRDETGEVTLAVEALDGSGDAKAARDGVFAVAGVVQDRLRESITLEVPGVLWLGYTSQTLNQAQTPDGAVALLRFTIAFKARI